MAENPPKVGQIISSRDVAHRDAIHVAVAPVIAAVPLKPGQHVGLREDRATDRATPIGIVDPYLKNMVQAGEAFYLFLYPGSIQSLRHEWTHPALPSDKEKEEAMVWLAIFARENCSNLNVFELIAGAHNYLDHGDYMNQGERFEGVNVPDEFWDYFQKATGRTVPINDRGHFFSCSC